MKTNLKLRRMERGMKQSDVADLVDVRRETIGRLEQGNTALRCVSPWIWRRCSTPRSRICSVSTTKTTTDPEMRHVPPLVRKRT